MQKWNSSSPASTNPNIVLIGIVYTSYLVGYYQSVGSCDTTAKVIPSYSACDAEANGKPLPPLTSTVVLGKEMAAPLPRNHYRIVVVADRDTKSAYGSGMWISNLRTGVLWRTANNRYKIQWEKEIILKTSLNEKGRGNELSELVYWNDMLLTFDDRSGIVFQILDGDILPRYILNDGDGDEAKGFKCEWATIKGGNLYVGSMGKEWTTPQGKVLNHNPQYVKVITSEGEISDVDWSKHYDDLKIAAKCPSPGYMIHEAVTWNEQLQQWFFLPRRVSQLQYDEKEDEHRGSNIMLVADDSFSSIRSYTMGPQIPTHGFSSVKFIPGSTTDIVALKSEEVDGASATYITVFNLSGEVLMEEVKIDDIKFEGVEFIPADFPVSA